MDFSTALNALKDGCPVTRAGWNGKGMFVYLVPAASYPVQTGAAKAYFGENSLVPYRAYLALKTVDDDVATWVPSVSDLLADDWQDAIDVKFERMDAEVAPYTDGYGMKHAQTEPAGGFAHQAPIPQVKVPEGMVRHIGTKIVDAKPMTRAVYNQVRGWELPSDEDGNDDGYLVMYTDGGTPNLTGYDGYVSWSPKAQFDGAYRPI